MIRYNILYKEGPHFRTWTVQAYTNAEAERKFRKFHPNCFVVKVEEAS